jgi:hypothetical protein
MAQKRSAKRPFFCLEEPSESSNSAGPRLGNRALPTAVVGIVKGALVSSMRSRIISRKDEEAREAFTAQLLIHDKIKDGDGEA